MRDTGLTTILVHTVLITPDHWLQWLLAQSRGEIQPLAVDGRDYLFGVAPRMRDVR